MRRARGVYQRDQLGQRFDGHEDRTSRQHGAGRTIRHPHRNRGRAQILLAEPHLATVTNASQHDDRLAMQRMPRIVNSDLLSVVGGM